MLLLGLDLCFSSVLSPVDACSLPFNRNAVLFNRGKEGKPHLEQTRSVENLCPHSKLYISCVAESVTEAVLFHCETSCSL